MDLSRLGPLQLDGMVKGRRFDLIIRSHAPLDEALRAELTGVFADSLSAVGFAGTLGFQSGPRGFVRMEAPPGSGALGVTA